MSAETQKLIYAKDLEIIVGFAVLTHYSDLYATIDHLIPQCEGGSNRRENLKLARRKCNEERGANEQSARKILKTTLQHLTFR